MAKRIIVLDTETTGLPQTYPGRFQILPYFYVYAYDKARLLQLAFSVYEETEKLEYKLLQTKNIFVKVEGEIPNSEIHGITKDLLRARGISIEEALSHLEEALQDFKVDTIIAHNAEFDMNIILSECARSERKTLINLLKNQCSIYCTMQKAKDTLKLERRPKLKDLHSRFFGKEFENQHSADADVEACFSCYKELQKILRKQV